MIGVNWNRYYKFQNNCRENPLDLIKTLIAQGADYDYKAKGVIKLSIKLDQEGIKEIEEFHKKYQTFAKSNLKCLCFKFFRGKNENLDSDKYNIPFELKREFNENN